MGVSCNGRVVVWACSQGSDGRARATDAQGDGARAEAGVVRAQDAVAEAGQAATGRDDRQAAQMYR